MADFYITYGDVGWELQITAKDATGTVVNLTDHTLTFKMASVNDPSTYNVDAAATVVIAANGTMKYVGLPGDATLPKGLYSAEFKVDPAGGAVFRVPTSPKIVVEVVGVVKT